MGNKRHTEELAGFAGSAAAYALVFLAGELLYRLTSGIHRPFRIARLWLDASIPVVLAAHLVALLVSAYVLLLLSYVGRLDPVVFWAVRAWRRGDYRCAIWRVQLFSFKGRRAPFISFLEVAANMADQAYETVMKAQLDESDIEDPMYQPESAKGRAALARLDYSVAISHFERLYARFPGAAISRYGLGDALLWAGKDLQRAGTLLTAALKDSDRSSLPHWNRLGLEAELRASHAWSLAIFGNAADQYSRDEALRLAGANRPVRAAVCLRLGNGLNAIGRRHSALEQWAAAYDVDPSGWSGNQAQQHIGGSRP